MTGAIDSHQHFWRRGRGDYAWLTPALAPIYRDYLPEDLAPQLARAGVERTILVQAAPTVAETGFLFELASRAPFVAGVVGWVDFEKPDAPRTITRLVQTGPLVGLRPMIQDIADDAWMLRADLERTFACLVEHGLVFDALVKPRHLATLRELAARHPDLRIVLDHAGKPPLASGDLGSWKRDVAALARETSVVCKLSGLVTEAGSSTAPALEEAVAYLLEVFGPARLLWGSDWPVCELVCSYSDWHDASTRLLASLGAAGRAQIFSETARSTYGI